MIQAMKNLNLLQKSGTSETVKSLKFETETIISSLCDYSDAFILVTGNIAVNAANDTDVTFKNCAPFSRCTTKINDVFVDEANHFTLQCSCTT